MGSFFAKNGIKRYCLLGMVLLTACTKGTVVSDGLKEVEPEKRLVIYTSHKEEVYGPVVREFEERTGIWVQVTAGGTTELLERIAAENGKKSCDLMFGGGVESYEVYKDCFERYESSQSGHIKSRFRSDDMRWTPFTELPIVLIYNRKLVDEANAPSGFLDLMSGDWDGKIAFADPKKSGSSCTALETMLQVLPMEEEEVLSEFSRSLSGKMSESSGAALEEVASGSRLVGITLEETAKKYIEKGADLSIIYPSEGTSAVPDGCAIVKGAEHLENARLFLDFIVGQDVQRLAEEKLYRRSVRDDIPERRADNREKIIDYDLGFAVSRQEKLLSRWEEIMTERKEATP